MIDIKFLRENPDIVKENIRKKFQRESGSGERKHPEEISGGKAAPCG